MKTQFIKTVHVPIDTGRKINLHKTFRRRPGHLLNVLCTFSLRPVSAGILTTEISKAITDNSWKNI